MADSDKSIHSFDTGTIDASTLFPIAYILNAVYATGKISASELGVGLGTNIDFNSLLTDDKTIFGAINELANVSMGAVLTTTLTAGSTSVTFTDSRIKDDSLLDIYTSDMSVNPTGETHTTGSVTYTFEAQSSDVAVAIVIKGYQSGGVYSEEVIWTSGDMSTPAVVGTAYSFSKSLSDFTAIKLVITSPSDGEDGVYSEEIWSVASINEAINNSLVINPVPHSEAFYGAKERYFSLSISNTGFTVTGNGAVGESANAKPSIFAVIGIVCAGADKIFDTGSVTSLVAVNSQQTLLEQLSKYDYIQVVFSDSLDGANGIVGTYGFDSKMALTQGMFCRAYWYCRRTMLIDFNDTTFAVTSSSSGREPSGYAISVYQIYGIKF